MIEMGVYNQYLLFSEKHHLDAMNQSKKNWRT
jgi:hypothetical protein